MKLMCAIWRIDRGQNTLVAVLDDVYIALDFLKTKPVSNVGFYCFTFCYEIR